MNAMVTLATRIDSAVPDNGTYQGRWAETHVGFRDSSGIFFEGTASASYPSLDMPCTVFVNDGIVSVTTG